MDVSIRPGWFYHNSQDESVRSPENLVDLWFTSVGSNAGFLLNLPPDRRGLVHENDVRSLAAFNKTLKMAFENNLCDNCKIIADNARLGCTPEAVISEDDNYFYSPKDGCTAHEITVLLDGEKEFNTVTLREVNGAGHRITDIEISACVNGEWIILQRSKCVGNRLAFRTGTVVSDKIKIKVISALGEPLIYGFGIYMLKYEETNKKADNVSVNYTDDPLCKVEKTDSEIDINLGGVFPFNYVSVEGVKNCEYTLCVFNGSRFVKIIEGQTADGTGEGAHLVGPGGADDMSRSAEGHTLGNGIRNAEPSAEGRAHDVGKNAGKDDGGGGDTGHAAGHFTEDHTNGSGDGFGQQRDGQQGIKAAQHAEQKDHNQTGYGTGGDACADGGQILPQQPELLIHGHSQTDSGRGQQPGDVLHACLILLNTASCGKQEHQNQHHGDEDGV